MTLHADQDFPSTIMTMLRDAADDGRTDYRSALDRMIFLYRQPLVTWLHRRTGLDVHEVEDLVQQFFLERMIEPATVSPRGKAGATENLPAGNLVAKYCESAGRESRRFRDYLRTAARNYVIDQLRRRKNRTADQLPDGMMDEVSGADSSSDTEFSIDFARTLLVEALRSVRQYCHEKDKWPVWRVFCARYLDPIVQGTRQPDFESLCGDGLIQSAHQARNLMQTAVRMFRSTLRSLVAASLPDTHGADSEYVEAEIADLLNILMSPGAVCLPESLLIKPGTAQSDTSLVVRLMQLEEQEDADWLPCDYAGLWKQILQSTLAEHFGAGRGETLSQPALTIGQLLQSEHPDLHQLQRLKSCAKQAITGRTTGVGLPKGADSIPAPLNRVLYALTLAVARLRLHQHISRGNPKEMTDLALDCRQVSGIDDHSRSLLTEWIFVMNQGSSAIDSK